MLFHLLIISIFILFYLLYMCLCIFSILTYDLTLYNTINLIDWPLILHFHLMTVQHHMKQSNGHLMFIICDFSYFHIYIYIYIYISSMWKVYIYIYRNHLWYNSYCHRKWTWQREFKSCMRLFTFHRELIL